MKIPNLMVFNLIKKNSEFRVSKGSNWELRDILEKEVLIISKKSKEICENSKRKTIKKSDIEIVLY